jgi:hypothetical protein
LEKFYKKTKTNEMRDIKFRVWDKINKEFSNHTNRDPFMDLSMGDIFYWERRQNEDGVYEGDIILKDENKNRFVLQQYTGLKDSFGKEIYEGDILKWKNPEDSLNLVTVRWTSEGMDYDGWITTDSIPQCGECKIIGNIFENPQLIK